MVPGQKKNGICTPAEVPGTRIFFHTIASKLLGIFSPSFFQPLLAGQFPFPSQKLIITRASSSNLFYGFLARENFQTFLGLFSPLSTSRFSPVSELPRLERWFRSDPNPSRQKLNSYANILNAAPYRRANNKVTYQVYCRYKNFQDIFSLNIFIIRF